MVLIRAMDARMVNLQRQGRIHFYGPITGQEAATVGSGYALGPDDWVFPALREAGVALLRGLPLEAMVAQCFGNARDTGKGRQMPCHYVDPVKHYVSMSSCIATQIPQAVGAAYAMKYRRARAAAIAYTGDGATSEADFHVAMNFAGVWKVPVVFFCQNNQWAITVPFKKQTATRTVAEKAVAYGFEGVRCDGNDVLACFAAARRALEKARAGGGPTLVEAVTYRVLGHTTSDDPTRYRDEAEVAPWRARDPIALFEARLKDLGLLDADGARAVEEACRAEVGAAIDAVELAPRPPVESLVEDVYAEVPQHLKEQLGWLKLGRKR
jgi:pyruvate dehydrogenase E1 component alpha subunit/2-oxoisovalerate dehydrogenase E1 component alpha subunit